MPLTGFDDIDTTPLSPADKAKAVLIVDEIKRHPADNPIQGPDLCHMCGLLTRSGRVNDAKLRGIVSTLRALGDPSRSRIASSTKGYWWEDDPEKLMPNVQHLMERARQEIAAYRGVERSFGMGCDVEQGGLFE